MFDYADYADCTQIARRLQIAQITVYSRITISQFAESAI
jgi:hypothetical protein